MKFGPLAARAANVEGAGAVSLRELVRQALRMRPDRIIVGEFRGAETVDLLVALNTGHEGSAATVHANTAADVPARLTALGALGGVSRSAMHEMASSALHAVVHLRRGRRGRRTVAAVGVLIPGESAGSTRDLPNAAGGPRVRLAWTNSGAGPGAAELARRLMERGHPVPAALTPAGGALL